MLLLFYSLQTQHYHNCGEHDFSGNSVLNYMTLVDGSSSPVAPPPDSQNDFQVAGKNCSCSEHKFWSPVGRHI